MLQSSPQAITRCCPMSRQLFGRPWGTGSSKEQVTPQSFQNLLIEEYALNWVLTRGTFLDERVLGALGLTTSAHTSPVLERQLQRQRQTIFCARLERSYRTWLWNHPFCLRSTVSSEAGKVCKHREREREIDMYLHIYIYIFKDTYIQLFCMYIYRYYTHTYSCMHVYIYTHVSTSPQNSHDIQSW